jgi:hypothetical protein
MENHRLPSLNIVSLKAILKRNHEKKIQVGSDDDAVARFAVQRAAPSGPATIDHDSR